MLVLTDLAKRYGDVQAVDGLSLRVRSGEVFGLLGPNGAGKSTTVGLSVGLLRPDRGSVSIGDAGAPTSPPVRAQLGLAPQDLALYERLSGEENLSFFATVHGLRGRARGQRVDWALDFVGLGDRRRDRVSTYSGGMKRRLNLAVALLHDPKLLVLDEPTVGVDPQSRNAIFDNIERLRDEGRTVVYTTHYMEEAERLCDRVGIIDHGKLLAIDEVDALIDAHGGPETLVASVDGTEHRVQTDTPLAKLEELAATGELGRFRVERPTLEHVFLALTGRSLRD